MIFTVLQGILGARDTRTPDIARLLASVGGSVDRAFRRALVAFFLAGLAASLLVSGIVMTIVTGVLLVSGSSAPEMQSLMLAGGGLLAVAVLLGLSAAAVARGRGSELARSGLAAEAPFAPPPPRAGSPLEEAVAALIMDFVQSREQARAETAGPGPRAQRQNSERRDSEFANRGIMN